MTEEEPESTASVHLLFCTREGVCSLVTRVRTGTVTIEASPMSSEPEARMVTVPDSLRSDEGGMTEEEPESTASVHLLFCTREGVCSLVTRVRTGTVTIEASPMSSEPEARMVTVPE